ncbi:DUF397 domain-containing protein [Amycolatopsis aidingensis]|uniref:DUF397 domain-containing protein n=1 Tax=Amycolatopsis aidingensis TaxID=2842453 RepID=UPI002FCBD398
MMSTPIPAGTTWRTSTRSQGNGACVEVAASNRLVAVRDTKNRNGGHLTLTRSAFDAFLDTMKERAQHLS